MRKNLLIVSIFSIEDWATVFNGKVFAVDCDKNSDELGSRLSTHLDAEINVTFFDSDDRANHDARITINGSYYAADINWAEIV